MKLHYKDKSVLIKKTIKFIQENNLSLKNLINFYVEINSDGYVLHLSKPLDLNPQTTINALHFYFKNLRKQ